MILYNEKEKQGKYVLSDSMLLVINSPLPIEVIYDKLRNGEEINDEILKINAYTIGDGKIRMEDNDIDEEASFSNIKIGKNIFLTGDDLENLESFSKKDVYIREPLFSMYERSIFGAKEDIKKLPFDLKKPQHREVLRKHIALSSSCMPTLIDDLDLGLEEIKKLSISGGKLFRDYGKGCVTKDNPLPTKEEINIYNGMNEYEKRLVGAMEIHPSKVIELKQALNGAVLTNDVYRKFSFFKGDVDKLMSARVEYAKPDLVRKFEDEFKNQGYRQSPRVLKEFIQGMKDLYGLKGEDFTSEKITEMVKKFDLKRFQTKLDNKMTVASSKNPSLIAMTTELNTNDIPQQLLRAMSVYIDQHNAKVLYDKGIVDWIKSNKNTNVSDFIEMIDSSDIIKNFDPKKSANELKKSLDVELGNRDAKLFEQKYKYKWSDNEIAIKGRHLVVEDGDYRMYMLAADDPRNFVSGYDTCCCQRWDNGNYHAGGKNYKVQVLQNPPTPSQNAGGSCVYKLTSDPYSANVVIEKKSTGEIVGQSFVWVDVPNDTFVFDNIEYANDGNSGKYVNIIGLYSKHIPYSNVHLGMGCNANQKLNGVGQEVKVEAKMPTTLDNTHIYSDYHKATAKLIKGIDGRTKQSTMRKYPLDESRCHITTAPDEPTKWDELANGTFSFLLNDCGTSIEQRFAMVEEFKNNPSDALQLQVVQRDPRAILALENPSVELQMYVFERNPEIAKMIENPCEELQVKILAEDPDYLRKHNGLSDNIICGVLSTNGTLISCIEKERITPAMCEAALKNSGYSWSLIPYEMKNEELAKITVKSSPKVLSLMEPEFITQEVQLIAARKEPSVVLLTNCGVQAQMAAISRKPDLILQLKNPTPPVVRVAIQKSPTLIRKFQYDFPSLRMDAIRRNGFVARDLKDLTQAEYNAAIEQNPNVSRFVENPATKNASNLENGRQFVNVVSTELDDDFTIE